MRRTGLKVLSVLLSFVLLFSLAIPAMAADLQTPFDDSQFYHQGDYSIHYRVIEPEGESKGNILFLHGFFYSGESFKPMADLMSDAGYTCVLVDLPNFGYSTRENADTELIPRETLVEGLMEELAPGEGWIVAGQSMGGGVALNIACDKPESVQALLLYAPAPINAVSDGMKNLMTSDFMGGMLSVMLKIAVRLTCLVRLMMYMATMDWDYSMQYDLSTLTDPLTVDGSGLGMMYMAANARPTDYAALAELKMPILLVRGDKDQVVSGSMSAEMDQALASAEKVTVEGAGHMLNETHAAMLSEQALAFLAENVG